MPSTPEQKTSRPQVGAELELTIDRIAQGGNGVARHNGYVVFVSGAVPGDTVLAKVIKRKRSYADARTIKVLTPSPERLEPTADHPGAPWQILPEERQLELKQEQVKDALERIGGFSDPPVEEPIAALSKWRYRNKLEFSFGARVDEDGSEQLVCGFHAPGHFDQIIPMDDCLLGSIKANDVRLRVVAWAREQRLVAWDRREHSGFLRNLVIREGFNTNEIQVRLVTSQGKFDIDSFIDAMEGYADGLFWTECDELGEDSTRGVTTHLSGNEQLREQIGDLEFLISPDAFFQTNTEMAEHLYRTAVEFADLKGTERLFDLYCGIGTIGLSMAHRAGEIIGVEIVESAVTDAIDNARVNEITNSSFYAGDIRLSMRELVEKVGKPDVVVIDPPRSGLSSKVVRRIIEAAPKRIVYVSCNPTTLAPNAAQLVEAGWQLKRVKAVEVFPQTPHIEAVALFERK